MENLTVMEKAFANTIDSREVAENEENSGNNYMIQDPIKRAERYTEEENEVAGEYR